MFGNFENGFSAKRHCGPGNLAPSPNFENGFSAKRHHGPGIPAKSRILKRGSLRKGTGAPEIWPTVGFTRSDSISPSQKRTPPRTKCPLRSWTKPSGPSSPYWAAIQQPLPRRSFWAEPDSGPWPQPVWLRPVFRWMDSFSLATRFIRRDDPRRQRSICSIDSSLPCSSCKAPRTPIATSPPYGDAWPE